MTSTRIYVGLMFHSICCLFWSFLWVDRFSIQNLVFGHASKAWLRLLQSYLECRFLGLSNVEALTTLGGSSPLQLIQAAELWSEGPGKAKATDRTHLRALEGTPWLRTGRPRFGSEDVELWPDDLGFPSVSQKLMLDGTRQSKPLVI